MQLTAVIDYIHEFHPYDAMFVVPVVVSAWLFWKHRKSNFTFIETLFGSVAASTVATLIIMAFIVGPWPLIGITLGFVALLYLPVCAAVGLATLMIARRA